MIPPLSEPFLTWEDQHASVMAARARMGMAPKPVVVRRALPPPPALVAVQEPDGPPLDARQAVIRFLRTERSRAGLSTRLAGIIADRIVILADEHGVDPIDVLSEPRAQHITRARQHAYAAIADALPDWSLVRIGHVFGRDHTSVLHGLQRIGAWPRKGRAG